MSSGVVSITDEVYARLLGPEAFAALVEDSLPFADPPLRGGMRYPNTSSVV